MEYPAGSRVEELATFQELVNRSDGVKVRTDRCAHKERLFLDVARQKLRRSAGLNPVFMEPTWFSGESQILIGNDVKLLEEMAT